MALAPSVIFRLARSIPPSVSERLGCEWHGEPLRRARRAELEKEVRVLPRDRLTNTKILDYEPNRIVFLATGCQNYPSIEP